MPIASPPFPVSGLVFQSPSLGNISYIGVPSTAWEIGTPVYDTPFAADPKKYVCRIPYMCKATQHAANTLALDAPGPYGGYHVGEDGFRDHAGGMLSFWREFALVPDSRNEYESYVHPIQEMTYSAVIGSAGTTVAVSEASISEAPVTVTSRVQFDYFRTRQPEIIQLDKAPRFFLLGDTGYMVGILGLVQGQEKLAEDAILRIWKGNIYERMQRFIVHRRFNEEI